MPKLTTYTGHNLKAKGTIVFSFIKGGILNEIIRPYARYSTVFSCSPYSFHAFCSNNLLDNKMQKCGLAVRPLHISKFQEGVKFKSLSTSTVGPIIHAVASFQNSLQEL
uniref:Uncharacterized protein n=1 Tax=Opuntia streptacantha TaxID=393608 RepID=A0A7C9EXG4_OPUST